MKQTKSQSAVKPQQDIPAAEASVKSAAARAKVAKERARQARARLKQARKAARQAKRPRRASAKNLDQAKKALRKLIRKAEKAAVRKLITPAKKTAPDKAATLPARRRRRFIIRTKPAVVKEPTAVEAPPDSGSSSGTPVEGSSSTQ